MFWAATFVNTFIFFCVLVKNLQLHIPTCSHMHVRLLLSPEHHEVLHHFFAQVVINSVDLFLSKEVWQVSWQLFRTLEVMTEWLLHNHPVPASTHTGKPIIVVQTTVIRLHKIQSPTPESISTLDAVQWKCFKSDLMCCFFRGNNLSIISNMCCTTCVVQKKQKNKKKRHGSILSIADADVWAGGQIWMDVYEYGCGCVLVLVWVCRCLLVSVFAL